MAEEGQEEWAEVQSKKKRADGKGGGKGSDAGKGPPCISSFVPRAGPASLGGGGKKGSMDPHEMSRKIFVNGLTSSITEPMLRAAFKHCGVIDNVLIPRAQDGSSLGFGFVWFRETSAADIAVRSSVRLDGKLCHPALARPRDETTGAPTRDHVASTPQARQEIQEFINKRELTGGAREALERAQPGLALRVIRSAEATNPNQVWHEGQIHALLQKVSKSQLSPMIEKQVQSWVAGLNLDAVNKDRVQSMLLGQRQEEIEHILELGRAPRFCAQVAGKALPAAWLFRRITSFKVDQTNMEIEHFCLQFNFPDRIQKQMLQLNAEKARKLMQNWRPSGTSSQMREDFQHVLDRYLKEKQDFLAQQAARQQERNAVVSHEVIMHQWSDEEDDGGEEVYLGSYESRAKSSNCVVVDADWEETWDQASSSSAPASSFLAWLSRPKEAPAPAGKGKAQHFEIHSGQGSVRSASASQVSHSSAGGIPKVQRRESVPTHFILVVDTSGSMANVDCERPKDEDDEPSCKVSRLDAVMETCSQFITVSHSEGCSSTADVYTFITFNEESVPHFLCQDAFQAVQKLEQVKITPERQTFYTAGIKAIDWAIKKNPKKMPAYVVFLSDGEPTDPKENLSHLQVLRRKHPGSALKIYTIGFGESAQVTADGSDFAYLQQIASLGGGHFQRSGASLSSLQGAFTAVTSTISQSRSSGRRSSGRLARSETTPQGANWVSIASASASAAGAASSSVHQDAIIEEGSEEDEDEPTAAGHVANAPDATEGPPEVEFELPSPDLIFKDVANTALWNCFKAASTLFKFNDGWQFKKDSDVTTVFVRRKPFMQGGMRLVYGMAEEKGADKLNGPRADEHRLVAKRRFEDLRNHDSSFKAHEAFCKSTAVADYFAKNFRQRLKRLEVNADFGFLEVRLFSPIQAAGSQEKGYYFCAEQWMKGHFVKLNSNCGYVNSAEYKQHSEIAQAFSHFTFQESQGELLVVDLQGMCGVRQDERPYLLLTDPQVHCRGRLERFGNGDLGATGMCDFFKHHKCSDLCHHLGLQRECDVVPPSHTFSFPALQQCMDLLTGPQFADFLRKLRKSCKISTIVVPTIVEEDKDWQEILIWASNKGGERAKEAFQKRFEAFYSSTREVVFVDQLLRVGVDRWTRWIAEWRETTGAMIIASPANWYQRAEAPTELWLLACTVEPGVQDLRVSHARREIQQALSAALEEVRAEQGSAPSAAQEPKWTQYKDDKSDRLYWYNETTHYWFFEDDPQWKRHYDDASRRWWWYRSEQEWFYEPS